MRHVSDSERRARLAVRHALHPDHRAATPEDATRAVAALHSTEPATPYLSCWARIPGLTGTDLDRALYADRTLVKQLAMRRTLFVFPRDLLAAVWPSASARVAAGERAAISKDSAKAGLADGWLDQARADVLALLADAPGGLTAAAVRQAAPHLDVRVGASPGVAWSMPRVLTHLGLTADLVRGVNTGRWTSSRPRWTLMSDWLDAVPRQLTSAEGYCELVRRWLYAFGPGTEDDLVWWLGATKASVRAALAALAAVPVTLDDGGANGWLLPDDVEPVTDPGPWVALLPVLDPTVMGWKGRNFYLGPHRARLFDTRGNAGTTAWADGRAVGCWVQDPAGAVQLRLEEEVSPATHDALVVESARLTEWLDGLRIGTVYKSPAMVTGK